LDSRAGDRHLPSLVAEGVAHPREHVADRVGHHVVMNLLPGRFANARDPAHGRQLAETDAADLELAVVGMGPTAELAAVVAPRRELGRPLALDLPAHLRHGLTPRRCG